MTPAELEELIADARRRVDEILGQARRDVERALTLLQDAVNRANQPLDMQVKKSDVHRLATSRGRGPKDAHTPVLEAAGLSAGDAAERAGWSEAVYSRCRKGLAPIPEHRALAVQRATISEAFPLGVEPNAVFWPAGVRNVKK